MFSSNFLSGANPLSAVSSAVNKFSLFGEEEEEEEEDEEEEEESTAMNQNTKEPPNYNTCTQCKTVVCSLCGFSPPDSAGKEWLCLNCQMQRALGGMDPPGPPMMKPQATPPRQSPAPPPQGKQQGPPPAQGPKAEPAKVPETKKPAPLKQPPDAGKPATPPATPPAAQKAPATPPATQKGPGQSTAPPAQKGPGQSTAPPAQKGPGQSTAPPAQKGPESSTPPPAQKGPGPAVQQEGQKPQGPQSGPQAQQKPPAAAQEPAKPGAPTTTANPQQQPPQKQPPQQGQPAGGAPKMDPKSGRPVQEPGKPPQQMPKGGPGSSPAKQAAPPQAAPPKQESGFFGLSFGGFSEPAKPQPAESVSGKLLGPAPAKPDAAPPAESVSGKMFGFGSSIFSSASNLITSAVQDETPSAPTQTPAPQKPPDTKPPPTKAQAPTTAPAQAEKPQAPPPKSADPAPPAPKPAKEACPLCKVELNVGSSDPPNYNTCTECKKTVCNLCGFNPMPHLNESEWLCLNCQTQRALAGQLGDMGMMPPPMPAPPKTQPSPAKQPITQATKPVAAAAAPPKPAPDQPKKDQARAPPVDAAPAPPPAEAPKKAAPAGQAPAEKPKDAADAAEQTKEEKKVEIVAAEQKKVLPEGPIKKDKEEGKVDTSGSSQQKSPQGLSDTGYSSEGISGSLGEIPSAVPTNEKELSIKPVQKDTVMEDTSSTSLSDLAKLESTVLPILQAQASAIEKVEPHMDAEPNQHRPKILPVSSESYSSGEEALQASRETDTLVKEPAGDSAPRKDRKKLHVLPETSPGRRQHGDSMDDSSESEPSPLMQRRRKISTTSTSSEDYKRESPCSAEDEEEFIRKQIMGMSADEEASPSDEDNYIRKQIREQEQQREEEERKAKEKITSPKSKRLVKNSSIGPEDEAGIEQALLESKEPESKVVPDSKENETSALQAQEAATESEGVEGLKTSGKVAGPVRQDTEEADQEVESLTESPDDRSRGEGSSSVHASSFTPGTSPTSVSSLDEDSDSSPSRKRMSGEGKQRKSRHRQHGQVLPTIEDSSEEEELREEEELLREQEMQREVDHQGGKKSSSKKSKKDKEELRAQRRREHPITPPSNLSPIEDASPTEELRQAAEMEELHKSSCSDYSPSIESEPEVLEVTQEKISVQKEVEPPTPVSVSAPTDEKHSNVTKDTAKKILKSADEAYEEIMQKAKALQGKDLEDPAEKEQLYSGMLIEDYIYESLVEDPNTLTDSLAQEQDMSKITVKQPLKKLRSPDEVYEDMMQKRKEMMLKDQELQQTQPIKEEPQPESALPPPVIEASCVPVSAGDAVAPGKDGKPLLDAEAAYEELMRRQRMAQAPNTSLEQQAPTPTPTAALPESPEVVVISSGGSMEDVQEKSIASASASGQESSPDTSIVSSDTSITRALYPIPDLKITQCSSGEEDIEEDDMVNERPESVSSSDIPQADTAGIKEEPAAPEIIAPAPVVEYAPIVSSVVSATGSPSVSTTQPLTSTPPVPPKPVVLLRASSQEKVEVPVAAPVPPPPLPAPPPATLPEPAICPQMPPSVTAPPVPVSTATTIAQATITTAGPSVSVKASVAPTYKPHVPPPVPPKPVSIPAGLVFSHKPGEAVRPPVTSRPVVAQQNITVSQPRPVVPLSTADMTLNLAAPLECKLSATSPRSPLSPRYGNSLHETYVVITLPSEPGTPVEGIITQAPTSPATVSPSKPQPQAAPPAPVAFTQYTKSVESQEIQGSEKVVSSMSHVYSSISTSAQPAVTLPNLVAQVVTTEVQRTTVSVVRERIPGASPSPTARTASVAITIPPETAKLPPKPKENGRMYYSSDVVDLRTLRLNVEMTEKGLDLSAPDSRRQSFSSDSSGRQTSAVQSSIVNLSAEATPASTLSVVTDSITIVTCTATIAYNNGAADRPLDLGHGASTSMPLQLTTSKTFEPVAQIIYRSLDAQPTSVSSADVPINLSFGAIANVANLGAPVTVAPASVTNGISLPTRLDAGLMGAVDLTTSKPAQTMVAIDGSNSAVVTSIVEDDGKPVDLTAGRRVVCCDMMYSLPFAGSCGAQQPPTTLPEDRHITCVANGSSDIKPPLSNNNLEEAGLFFSKSKNGYDYTNGASEGAIDLTAGKMSAGEIMDYSNKGAGTYPGITIPQYSQVIISPAGTHFGGNSVLRSSNGVVYSSIAAPVPSTYAITTQPGSIFSTTYNALPGTQADVTMPALSSLQDQGLQQPYSFLSTTAAHPQVGGMTEGVPSAFPQVVPSASSTTLHDPYTDATLEAIAASLEALSSPLISDDPQQQQYQMEREILELEKLKQLRLAEELEWERLEIQRYREQEQILVQKELEELQSMKQQLLLQQEEERQAHLLMQQETYAQQQLQLEQIQHLQLQLQQQLEEQKMRHLYPYGYDPPEGPSPVPGSDQITLDSQYTAGDNGQYWPVQDDATTTSSITGIDLQQNTTWYTVPTEGVAQYISSMPGSAEIPQAESQRKQVQIAQSTPGQYGVGVPNKKIVDSGVQTDEEDGVEKAYSGRRRRNKKSVDSSVQTDDEDQEEWDIPARSRRRSRSSKQGSSKVSSIAIQTVAEISVQTDSSGTIKRPSVRAQLDTKVEIGKHGSEKAYRGGGQGDSGSGRSSPEKDKRRPTPLEIGYSTHLKADSSLQVAPSPPKSPKVLYSPISPLSPSKSIEFVPYEKSSGDMGQKMLTTDPSKPPQSPRTLKAMQRSMSDPKSLSPTADDRAGSNLQYSDSYSSKGSQSGTLSGTQKKVKRTLPNPPPEEETMGSQSGYSTGSARRRLCRNTTIARAKILQDIDRELDLVERESSKLRKKQAELDEEEKEIDAKLRYLEMGINRRKEALLKEREKRERAYLQGVAEERDYMSDSEVSNIRETRAGNGHERRERPRTAPQSEFSQFVPPQTQTEAQYGQSDSPYAQYQYAPQTQAATQYSPQTLYQQPSLYHQQVSPYQSQSIYSSVPSLSYTQSSQQQTYQQLLLQQKARQATLSELDPKITTNYEVIRNQPLITTDPTYGMHHLGGGSKYGSLELRMGLEERGSMASSPMSSVSAESFYADIDHHHHHGHHAPSRSYVLIDDIGELTKGSSAFTIPDKDLAKADRLLRAAEVRRAAEVSDFLGPLQASARLHPYGKPEEESMEEPYELKLLKQQIKQEFRRGAEGLDHLTGLPHYYPGESGSYRHFPKAEKYSIGRLTLEKQAAKQLPASVLYQKQVKQHKKALMDPKVVTKFSPIQESRDLEPDYASYLGSSTSSVSGLSSRARLLQDEITFGLRKNIAEQQKYLGSTLGANLAHSLNLGQSLNLGPTMRSSLQDDGTYPSGSRSRPSSRPSSVYGLDLSIKRDSSSSSLRMKTEGEALDSSSYSAPTARAKPTSLPISQSRGRIPIVAQNSEEESPLSPVAQPMGMARASAGPLPPISADSRDQFGSSHSLPEVQQHMREESRTRGYDRDIAFIMDDLQGAMSDSEAGHASWEAEAYHLRREETDWFDKPREGRMDATHALDRRQMKPTHYPFPHTRVKLQMDPKDRSVSGNGLGIRVVGGKEIPGSNGDIGAYIAKVLPGGAVEQSGQVVEGMQVLEWNGVPLTGKTYEDVQSLVGQQCTEAEVCVRLDLNMLSDSEHPQHLELHGQTKAVDRQRSPGVDPKQLAAELQKVSQQQAPSSVSCAVEKGLHAQSGTASAASSAVPSPGQPGSPSISKKKHSSKSAETVKTQAHPITGEIQLQINYDKNLGNLIVHVLQARNLAPRDNNGYSDPFVKVYLLPGRGQVMVVQNASAENKRRTKHMQKSLNPEWNQTVIYKNIHLEQLKKKTLEVTVWDYDRFSSNDFLGEVLIDLSNTAQLDNTPRWFPLKEQNEGTDSRTGTGTHQSPKTSVIKSRSHGIFPDPSKDMQVPTIEKSHSSPGSSKPSSHSPAHGSSKSSAAQAHLDDPAISMATGEAGVHLHRLQPTKPGHRATDEPVTTTPSITSLGSSGTNLETLEEGTNAVNSAIFQVPRLPLNSGKTIPNGADKTRGLDSAKPALGIADMEGKTQVMGEIKVALKKEMKTEGEQLIVEILQCRNITYKFKTPDHLPDLYVKLYVVNVATQKRVIKKKTRVCRHDREPSFNETFRFGMNPAGHSIQLFLVSNGGKFVKKTLIGEAYIWLDKVDLRKRAVSWHKLLASSLQTHP
ncbi:hypothetical protein AGOR_G00016640 [Albula goreensis]|uniref:Protein piccolo n=1 Tax=Albula goreensis TaxID=1534307 RepID=A0A8T3E7S8_9TELE|nr:hypothetical protein AGOR_G00016640 [Albula goreensis]